MSYLAIDPGIDTGWAFFRSATELLACGVDDARKVFDLNDPALPVRTVIMEKPQVYLHRQKTDPNNLITLAIQVGRYIEHFERTGARVTLVRPAEWKGQIPKEIQHARIWSAMSAFEQGIVDRCLRRVAPSRRHNAMDAVAMGKIAFQRKLWA